MTMPRRLKGYNPTNRAFGSAKMTDLLLQDEVWNTI
jgi:hypothetical protein